MLSIIGFAMFLVLQCLDLHSSYLLSRGVMTGSVHTVDSRLISTAQELAREVNPVLSGARTACAFLIRLIACKVLVVAVWSYTLFTQIFSTAHTHTHAHSHTNSTNQKFFVYFFYLSMCLNLIYFVVVFNNYTLISKALS